MDPLIIGLLLFIMLLSGCIGMLADSLGRKIGKKKLSFRSMRPKHVARLGTFIAGMLVSGVTLLMVFVLSSDVREWITKGRQAITRSHELEAKNEQLASEIQKRTDRIDLLDKEAHVASAQLLSAQQRLAGVQTELKLANSRYEEAKVGLAKGRLALAESKRRLEQNGKLLDARQKDLSRVSKNLADARDKYATLSRNYVEVDRERTEADEKVVELNRQEEMLKSEVVNLMKDKAQLEKDKISAQNDIASAQAKVKEQIEAVDEKRAELSEIDLNLAEAKRSSKYFLQLATLARTERLVFPRDQEITRIKVGPHLTRKQATDAVDRLVRDASRVAESRGATVLPGGEYSADFFGRPTPTGEVIPAEAQRQAVIDALTNYQSDVVLIARSYINAFRGEFVQLDIKGYPDPVVYHRGEVLAELHVQKNTPRDKVLVEFDDFMRTTVLAKALKQGMIRGGDDDLLVDVEASKTMDLVYELADSVRNVRLQIIARADTRAADSLQLDFLIK